jgi:hypothetical protein
MPAKEKGYAVGQRVYSRTEAGRLVFNLGPGGRFQRSSSMLPVVEAVAPLNCNHIYRTKASCNSLRGIIDAIKTVPVAKRMKYQRAPHALFPKFIYVTTEPFDVNEKQIHGGGIYIARPEHPSLHQVDTVLALEELHNSAVGRELLQAINKKTREKKHICIVAAGSQGNRCAVDKTAPSACRTTLQAAFDFRSPDLGRFIGRAMTKLGNDPATPDSYGWLRDRINATPIYKLLGPPNETPSSASDGAATAMTHIAIQESLNGKNVDWLEKVSDEQYRR